MDTYRDLYDVLVVGGGYAGCEAAMAASRYVSVVLVTKNLDTICKPSLSSHRGSRIDTKLLQEIKSMGVIMSRALIRINRRTPPTKINDRNSDQYHAEIKKTIERQQNLDLCQGTVAGIRICEDKTFHVATKFDQDFRARSLILCPGIFLRTDTRVCQSITGTDYDDENECGGLMEDLILNGIRFDALSRAASINKSCTQRNERAQKLSVPTDAKHWYLAKGQVRQSLEHKAIQGLFFAGEVLGAISIIESAATGLVAGLSAADIIENRRQINWPEKDSLRNLSDRLTST